MMLETSQKKPEKIPEITEAKIMTYEGNKTKTEFSKRSYAELKRKKIVKEKHYTYDNLRRINNISATERGIGEKIKFHNGFVKCKIRRCVDYR